MSQIAVVPRRPPLTPVRLILIDEADRLKVASLEQLATCSIAMASA